MAGQHTAAAGGALAQAHHDLGGRAWGTVDWLMHDHYIYIYIIIYIHHIIIIIIIVIIIITIIIIIIIYNTYCDMLDVGLLNECAWYHLLIIESYCFNIIQLKPI